MFSGRVLLSKPKAAAQHFPKKGFENAMLLFFIFMLRYAVPGKRFCFFGLHSGLLVRQKSAKDLFGVVRTGFCILGVKVCADLLCIGFCQHCTANHYLTG